MKSLTITRLEGLKYGRREAMNSLKTNMQFAGVGVKTVIVTSCGPGEGKSTVSFELAKSLADSGKNVIFIDSDMRKSQIVNRYKIENQGQHIDGLTHYLSGQGKAEDIICSTNVDKLKMILAGPRSTNPTELLAGDRFRLLVKALEKVFDFIIIDSPPLGAVIDTAIMAPVTDGVIVVLESNRTSTKDAQRLIAQLEMSGSRILGYVLNKVSAKDEGYHSKYKYY